MNELPCDLAIFNEAIFMLDNMFVDEAYKKNASRK